MMTWPRGEEYYKNKKIITVYKMGKEIIAFGNNEVEKKQTSLTQKFWYLM